MYTTGGLDKSTHKKFMYVGFQHVSAPETKKKKRKICWITNKTIQILDVFSTWKLPHVLKFVPHTTDCSC